MPNIVSVLLLCFFCCQTTYATQTPDITFGQVSQAELRMTHSPLDSSASAMILGDFGESHFQYNQNKGIRIVFTRHTRIKVFNSDGYGWANAAVSLYERGSDKEVISQIKGYTYRLEGDKIIKTKLKNNGKFREQYSDNIERVKFTLPDVQEGSVIEYSYTITSDFLFNLREWQFQHDIPTAWSEYKVKIPEYFQYKQLSQGYHPLALAEQSQESGYFVINYRTGGQNNRQPGQHREDFVNTVYHWAAQDVPALTEEPYITTMNDYVSKISFEIASVRFPGQPTENYTTTWKNIDKELLDYENFGKRLTQSSMVKEKVRSLAAGTDSETEKVAKVYRFVRDHIRWNGEEALTTSQSLKKTLQEKSGNSADINLLLVDMLRAAGLSTQPVALSTRAHGMIRQQFPMLKQFNYVIAYVSTANGAFLLDATETACPYNLLPIRCLNEVGRIISASDGEKWVSLQPKEPATHMILVKLSLEEDGLRGNIASSHSSYDAVRLRQRILAHKDTTTYIAQFQKKQHNLQISHFHFDNLTNLQAPVKERFAVLLDNHYQAAGDLIYLNPFVVERTESNPFKLVHREYPVDFPYPQRETYIAQLTIPEGYTVDELPEDLMIALPDQGGRYIFSAQVMGNQLQISSKLDINKIKFYAQEYPHLKEFFNQVVAKQNEQVVLKKQ